MMRPRSSLLDRVLDRVEAVALAAGPCPHARAAEARLSPLAAAACMRMARYEIMYEIRLRAAPVARPPRIPPVDRSGEAACPPCPPRDRTV